LECGEASPLWFHFSFSKKTKAALAGRTPNFTRHAPQVLALKPPGIWRMKRLPKTWKKPPPVPWFSQTLWARASPGCGEEDVILSIASIIPGMSILPILVFISETCVVTLSTVRTIFVARGMRIPAAFLGFFEVSIWLFAIGQVMQNLSSPDCFLAFATGFSLGNYLGVSIEKKLAVGNVAVQITTRKNVGELVEGLRSAGYGVTTLEAQGATGRVQVVFTVIPRKDLGLVAALTKAFDPHVFYSVSDVQTAAAGVFPLSRRRVNASVPALLPQIYQAVIALGSTSTTASLPTLQEVATEAVAEAI
jgi:uncharacterized protein YebE (UPF0316 family)